MNDNFDSICHKTVPQNCADPCKFACDSYREDRTYKKLQENRSQHLKIKMLFNFVAKWFCCRRAGRFNVWRQFSKAGIWFSEKLMAKTLTWYYTNIWRNKTIFSIYWSETCTHLQQLKTSWFLSQILFYFVCIYYRGFCSAISSSNRRKHPFGWGSPYHLRHMNSCKYSKRKSGFVLPFILLNLSFAVHQLLSACWVWMPVLGSTKCREWFTVLWCKPSLLCNCR